ncbi:uncharacterized protein LOC110032204 [Phalaenopsis equestris]|uniref:uncharacterized protein LOC110032204 n=1 Tax=Phalaenopsis equestris TaxID=78828 RepID=UPI0009E409EA|nr:uncharacterized protein LOC110032204 [Phalaenopsis equestris]
MERVLLRAGSETASSPASSPFDLGISFDRKQAGVDLQSKEDEILEEKKLNSNILHRRFCECCSLIQSSTNVDHRSQVVFDHHGLSSAHEEIFYGVPTCFAKQQCILWNNDTLCTNTPRRQFTGVPIIVSNCSHSRPLCKKYYAVKN